MTEASSRPGALRAELAALPAQHRAESLLHDVRSRAARLLGLPAAAAVDPDTPWIDLGFDSLRAVDLRSELAHALDLELRSTLLFDQAMPRVLVAHLLALLAERAEPVASPAARPARAHEPIAIVGAACRFPGGDGLDEFWRLLVEGHDAVAAIPRERFDVDALFDADPAADGKIYVRDAGLLHGIDRFDAAFFGISPREATALDPQQRLLLEVCWHALEHANLPPRAFARQRVGVYVGVRSGEYFDSQTARTPADADAYYHTGNQLSTAAGRIAYSFGFHGPCYALDTACSGSLVAVHVAVRALRAGECDVAIVGGVNVILDPVAMAGLCRARMLSPDGRCKSFDAAADGYGRGEGCGVVVLRALRDAQTAGDRVFGVVVGTAINQDGRSSGLTVPHGPSQVAVVRDALADAGLLPDAIDYVEAHGTGTNLGDPIEVASLNEVFAGRARPLPVGSVKTNIGHLEAAAGIAGLVKTVLALQQRTLPATLHFRVPNPHIDWANGVVRVASEREALPATGDLHAGVSSFGFSGTNCHVVVRSAPAAGAADARAAGAGARPGPWLLPLQAADPQALRELAARHADALVAGPVDLAAWCHAAAVGRASLPVRAALVAADAAGLAKALRAFAGGDERAATAAGVATDQTPPPTAPGTPYDVAAAWVRSAAVDLAATASATGPRAMLPLYPFQRRRCWFAPAAGAGAQTAATLLGERRETSLLAPGQMLFTNTLSAHRPAWLADHQALGRVLLPLAGMLEMALAAEAAAGTPLPLALRCAVARTACPLGEQGLPIECVRTAADGAASFVLRSRRDEGTWRPHFEGTTSAADATVGERLDLEAVRARCRTPFAAGDLYARAEALQFRYGPAFRGVRSAWCGDGEALAEVELPARLTAQPFVIHPALLDACLQLVLALLPPGTGTFLPRGLQSLVVHRRGLARVWCHARLGAAEGTQRRIDYVLADDAGNVVARLDALQLVAADAARLRRPALPDVLHHVAWQVAHVAATAPLPARIGLVGWPKLAAALQQVLPKNTTFPTDDAGLPALLATQRLDVVLWLAEPQAGDDADPLRAQARLLAPALAILRAAARADRPPRLGLVTHGVQFAGLAPAGPIPHASTLLGVWRTLAHEHAALRPFAIDLDALQPAADVRAHAELLADELRRSSDESEVAFTNGVRRVRRLRRGAGPADHVAVPDAPFRVRASQHGSFASLAIATHSRRAPGPHEVELAITAAALNFKDTLHVRGLLRTAGPGDGPDAAGQPLGYEACGVVTAVGDRVTHVRAGERALVLAADCLASHVTVPGDAVVPLPAGVDAVAAAGAPVVVATVHHALVDLARVRAGETVLVHAAAGGVGQAALALLRSLGCRALATASASKRSFVESLGAEVVGDSRRFDWGPAVLAATAGRGVDVVLNTLAGDAVPKALDVLARGGRFVELGKLGVWSAERVRAHRPDVEFHALDLGDAFADDPTLRPRLLEQLCCGLATDTLQLPTATVAPLARVREAFEHLGTGRSVGKVVLTIEAPAARLRGDRTVLLTGASGGTAPAIAEALVDAGARHLALLARGEIPASRLAALRARGCTVVAVRADVGDRTALAAALAHVRAAGPPLGGIVHAAGALADATLATLAWEHAEHALRAKVAGAIWLDELTATDELAFFVLTSSMAATLGNAGQAAYAAANAFLDAFAAWRRARGRPAASIAFGPWDGAGMTGRLDEPLRARLRARGITPLAPAAASKLLVAHRASACDVAVLPVRWSDWLLPFGADVPATWRELLPKANAAPPAPAPLVLDALAPEDRASRLRTIVRTEVAKALGFTGGELPAHNVTFRDLGLDSLLAVEAKELLERALGRALPASLLFDQPDVDRLVAHLLQATPV